MLPLFVLLLSDVFYNGFIHIITYYEKNGKSNFKTFKTKKESYNQSTHFVL